MYFQILTDLAFPGRTQSYLACPILLFHRTLLTNLLVHFAA